MRRSTNRVLTTHVGRLDGPPELRSMVPAFRRGGAVDEGALAALLPEATAFVIRKQLEAGIDIISNGEVGAIGFGLAHYGKRLSGLTTRTVAPGDPAWMSLRTGERLEFADFYKELNWVTPSERVICSGPLAFIGSDAVHQEIDLFKTALAEAGASAHDAFMCVLSPGWLEHFFHNEHYATDEAFLFALADAMKHEYKAVVDAGLLLQIDDPALPDTYDMIVPQPSIDEYRRFAAVRIAALNRALDGLPEDRIRYHICWGSWHGPHTHDLPLAYIVDLMLDVKAGAYSLEAANPRHEHEWKVWKNIALPDGKLLIPGVVSHATNVVEHPELVADRIVRFANLVGRERTIAGTDCGLGHRVHPQIAWAKLKALSEGAALASKALWG
jgi:5-methyltetrahydropteroyltriglutamate--homocysteine methyltransferase